MTLQYEAREGYPEYYEFNRDGSKQVWGRFGYPDAMLSIAINSDDAEGFRYYFDRFFGLECMTIGGSIVLIVANKGAEKCVRELIKLGAKDSCYSADKLIARAKQVAAKKGT